MTDSNSTSRVTLRDVADRLNVSHTTVSRALRSDPRISPAMRERVREMVREMGYQPDPMLRALAHYRRGKQQLPISAELAWINHWRDPQRLRSYREFDLYWRGATEEALESGFRLEEFILGKQLSSNRLEKILKARNIRGILIPPHGDTPPDWRDFNWDDFCIVRFGHSIVYPRAHIVTSDQLTDGLIAFENMWKRGYGRIGLITYTKSHTRFSAGYFFGQMKWSPRTRLPVLVLTQQNIREDQRLLKSWIKRNRPDAILTDLSEIPGMLRSIGYRIPDDISVAALSVLDGNADAGIDQNSREIGRVAVQLLISLINHNECGIPQFCREVLVEGTWTDGSTLPIRSVPEPR
jgi:LacI family transcriptional regulator